MKKHLMLAGLALALSGASAATMAAPGNFYMEGGVGAANWRVGDTTGGHIDNTTTSFDARFGYMWHSTIDFGVEAGYASLGKITNDDDDSSETYHASAKIDGPFAGIQLRYAFTPRWFVSARGGLIAANYREHDSDTYALVPGGPTTTDKDSYKAHKLGEYAGIGVGYAFNHAWTVSADYDYYHAKFYQRNWNIGTASLRVGYAF